MEKYIVHCYVYDYDEGDIGDTYICHSLQEARRIANENKDCCDSVTIYKAIELENYFPENE